jgi:hypothetical protein
MHACTQLQAKHNQNLVEACILYTQSIILSLSGDVHNLTGNTVLSTVVESEDRIQYTIHNTQYLPLENAVIPSPP